MIRIQFHLRLAYCMTYNKRQGQTLQKVLLDVSTPFAHGHLYVTLSRVTNSWNIKIICKEEQIYQTAPMIWNTAYADIYFFYILR
jgi:ATP-dependent exoDNAse (exonuclease V) alpha subunit